MGLKHILKRLLPPVMADAARRLLKGKTDAGRPEWEFAPGGWRTQGPGIKGWNVESTLETEKAKWPEFVRAVGTSTRADPQASCADDGLEPECRDTVEAERSGGMCPQRSLS